MIGVDEVDEVPERQRGGGVVEREPVAVLKGAACGADVVELDPLQIVCGVVTPLLDAPRIELRRVRTVSRRVDGEPLEQGTQRVVRAGRPAQVHDFGEVDSGRVE